MISERYRILKGLSGSSDDTGSSSATDIFMVKDLQNKKEYVIKIFVEEYFLFNTRNKQMQLAKGGEAPDLLHEIRMYKTIRDTIIIPFNVRNLLCIQGDGRFTNKNLFDLVKRSTSLSDIQVAYNIIESTKYMMRYSNDSKRNPIDSAQKVHRVDKTLLINNKYVFDFEQPIVYHGMVTPKLNPKFIDDCINPEKTKTIKDPTEFMNYVFLVMVTEFILSGFGLNHNDLHPGNIFLDDKYFGPSKYHKRVYLLVYNQTVLLIDNPYIPYIYDFDRSVRKGIIRRSLKDEMLLQGGNCPKFHPKRDFLKTLCMVFQFISYYNLTHIPEFSKIQYEIINNLVSSPKLRRIIQKSQGDAPFMCPLSDIDRISASCKDEQINTLVKREEILDWGMGKTSYSSFTLDQLLDVEKNREKSLHYESIMSTLERFKEGMVLDHLSIYANIQFLNCQDIHYWDLEERKNSFVHLIYDLLK
jgi:hypothetical protein